MHDAVIFKRFKLWALYFVELVFVFVDLSLGYILCDWFYGQEQRSVVQRPFAVSVCMWSPTGQDAVPRR